MNRTTWIIIAAICVLGIGGLIIFTKKDAVNVDDIDVNAVMETTDSRLGDHVRGKQDSKVILVEYADFQCPGCRAAHSNTAQLYNTYEDSVLFVFRNFPLSSMHPNALAAASFAEAAGLQGKYWEMNDALFTNQTSWSQLSSSERTDAFVTIGQTVQLDTAKLKEDAASNKQIQEKIALDRALANKKGVTATPTFFLNGEKVDSETVDDLLAADGGSKLADMLDAKIRENGGTPPARNN